MSLKNRYEVYYCIYSKDNTVKSRGKMIVSPVKGMYVEDVAKIYISTENGCNESDIDIIDVIFLDSEYIDDEDDE